MSNPTFKTTEINSREAWVAWEGPWNDLVEHHPMRSTTWLLEWWDQFQSPSKSLCIRLFEDGDRLIGIAPIYRVRVGSQTVLRLLGDSGGICTDHTTWFSRPEFAEPVGESVAHELLSADDWSRLQFESINETDVAMATFITRLKVGGCLLHSTPRNNCWSVDLPDTWDDYLGLLSKNHRKRCRRWVRNYFDNGKIQVRTATTETWNESWETFLDLHRQRWGDAKRPAGCFSSRQFASFHRNVARRLFDLQQLRLCSLTLDGQPIASEYQLLDRDTLYSYQSGMSPQHSDVGPGNLSLVATLRYCFDHGIRRLDLLRGDEPYKAHWQAKPSAQADLRVWRPGWNGQMEYSLQKARRLAADWLRR